jgi:hypothetical protein
VAAWVFRVVVGFLLGFLWVFLFGFGSLWASWVGFSCVLGYGGWGFLWVLILD